MVSFLKNKGTKKFAPLNYNFLNSVHKFVPVPSVGGTPTEINSQIPLIACSLSIASNKALKLPFTLSVGLYHKCSEDGLIGIKSPKGWYYYSRSIAKWTKIPKGWHKNISSLRDSHTIFIDVSIIISSLRDSIIFRTVMVSHQLIYPRSCALASS